MALDDRFDDLIASLGGFHRSWLVYLGIELGLFARVRAAGRDGLTPAELAAPDRLRSPRPSTPGPGRPTRTTSSTLEDGRLTIDHDVAVVLLDEGRPEYLGGQFVHAAVASLDWGGMVDFFRTGHPIGTRPDRYRVAIERLTAQDIAVFFQEALAELPQLVADLSRGGSRRRRPLRRRAVAHRDGPAVPGARAGRHRVRSRIRSPGRARTSPRPGWPTGSRSARRA